MNKKLSMVTLNDTYGKNVKWEIIGGKNNFSKFYKQFADIDSDFSQFKFVFIKYKFEDAVNENSDNAYYLSYNDNLPYYLLLKYPNANWKWSYLTINLETAFIFDNLHLDWTDDLNKNPHIIPSFILYHYDLYI